MKIIATIHCNTKTYLKKVGAVNVLYFACLSLFLSSCGTTEILETNLPNYELIAQGNSKNPTILFFQDPSCTYNDSLAKQLIKQKFHVIRITKVFTNPLELFNQDHPTVRAEEGNQLFNSLNNNFDIQAIAASGIEVHSITPWYINLPVLEVYLYPYYPGSLADHIRLSMATGNSFLPNMRPVQSSTEFYSLLEGPDNPTGRLGNYSYRFYKAIWNQQPLRDTKPFSGKVYFKVLP